MTKGGKKNKKEIAVIAPAPESLSIYDSYLSKNQTFTYRHFLTVEEFTKQNPPPLTFAGFVIDLRVLIRAKQESKEFVYTLIESVPVIRASHNPEGDTVTGNLKGKTLKNNSLFDYFFDLLSIREDKDGPKKLVLICSHEESLDLYKSQLAPYKNIRLESYRTGRDFLDTTSKNKSYCGFMVDLRTILKGSPEDKDFFYELLNSFPVMRISHSKDKKTIKGNFRSKNYLGKEVYDYFLNDICAHFEPRGIRTTSRRHVFLNLLLRFPNRGAESYPVKTNTVDVSESGLFIVDPRPPKKHEPFRVVINELSDSTAIEGTVRWVLPWGESIRHLPGFGCDLKSIKPQQKEELLAIMRKSL